MIGVMQRGATMCLDQVRTRSLQNDTHLYELIVILSSQYAASSVVAIIRKGRELCELCENVGQAETWYPVKRVLLQPCRLPRLCIWRLNYP